MTRKGNPEDARLWIAEAEKRLEHAKDYIPRRDRRIFCEQAHYAAEFAIKGLIVAGNGEFQFTHDIGVLLEAVRKTGETIPREAEDATILSPYGGPGRYSFERARPGTGDAGRIRAEHQGRKCSGGVGEDANAGHSGEERRRRAFAGKTVMLGGGGGQVLAGARELRGTGRCRRCGRGCAADLARLGSFSDCLQNRSKPFARFCSPVTIANPVRPAASSFFRIRGPAA